jgi:hypothetical protein
VLKERAGRDRFATIASVMFFLGDCDKAKLLDFK